MNCIGPLSETSVKRTGNNREHVTTALGVQKNSVDKENKMLGWF